MFKMIQKISLINSSAVLKFNNELLIHWNMVSQILLPKMSSINVSVALRMYSRSKKWYRHTISSLNCHRQMQEVPFDKQSCLFLNVDGIIEKALSTYYTLINLIF